MIFCVAEKEREREQWKSIQEVAVVEEVAEVVEVDEENEEFSRSRSLSFSFSPTFLFSSTREKRAKKTRRSLFHPFLLVSLQDGVFRAHELAQLLHDRGHDERQGRGAAPRATRHDGRTSGRGAASENVGDEKGRFDIIGGDDDHDSEPFELFVVVDELLGWRSCERPLQRRLRDVAARLGTAAQAVCPGGAGRYGDGVLGDERGQPRQKNARPSAKLEMATPGFLSQASQDLCFLPHCDPELGTVP